MADLYAAVRALLTRAEQEHGAATSGTERTYWQGCKDGIRRCLAVIDPDAAGTLGEIIRSSEYARGYPTIADEKEGQHE